MNPRLIYSWLVAFFLLFSISCILPKKFSTAPETNCKKYSLQSVNAWQLYYTAKRFQRNGNYLYAEGFYAASVRQEVFPEAMIGLGTCWHDMAKQLENIGNHELAYQRIENAKFAYRKVLEMVKISGLCEKRKNNLVAQAYLYLGKLFYECGDFWAARGAYRQALSYESGEGTKRYLKVKMYSIK
jgi:tetratricopeptide (TPR) repeat protein